MSRKLVDVEECLQWAASELARKRPARSAAPVAFDVSRSDRELVGRWNRPAGYPTVAPGFNLAVGGKGSPPGDPPHADALVIESALARLALISPPCSVSEAELVAGIGFEVDAAGALRAGLANAANLALVHGGLASRPILWLKALTPSPKMAPNGRPGVWRRERWAEPTWGERADSERDLDVAVRALRKDSYPDGAFCVVEWDPHPQEITNERAEYAAWRASLEWLAVELAGKLESRAALPPRAAARPWMGDVDGEPVRDLFAPGAEGVFCAADADGLAGARAAGQRRPIAGGGRIYSRRPIKPAKGVGQA